VTLYAAYGSNLDPHRMAERAPASPVFGTGWLRGWRLTFAGEELGVGGSMCTVVEDERESVFVMLYDVPPIDEQALDEWEDVDLGLWRKVRVRVDTLDGDPLAWLYVLDAYEGGLPSTEHVSLIAGAAQRAGAPADYVAMLLGTPSRPNDEIPND
jgi:gamma-glutamylcyclotransferase (GGCT)/AIG2-like uncharacterized protein YtfP